MDDNFYDNDFEKFLQQQVKHHRMYPSDAVWKGIYKQMHGNRKWPGLYFFGILMVAALTVCTVFIESKPIIYSQQKIANLITPTYNQLNPVQTTEHTFKQISRGNEVVVSDDIILPPVTGANNVDLTTNTNDLVARYEEVHVSTFNSVQSSTTIPSPEQDLVVTAKIKNDPSTSNKLVVTNQQEEEKNTNSAGKNSTDEYLEQNPEEADRIVKQQLRKKSSRWQMQYYITPSLNYRQIIDENRTNTNFYGPIANNNRTSANKVIRYKPGMGIEVGIGALYSLTNRIKIKAAIQYNIRQFNIEAYSGSSELAKITAQQGNPVYAVTKYRSTGVNSETELINKYHQLSLPVGLEYSILKSENVGIQIAGTLQPTYTFSQSAYLLTSDYKSYANGKEILRNWNINSSLEATFSLKGNNVEWKFGPQLRYQHLPTYSDNYTIKEFLVDYGFKIGFTKTIQ
jgi:hypothetical protein